MPAMKVTREGWVGIKDAAARIGLTRNSLRLRANRELDAGNKCYRRFGDMETSPIYITEDEVRRLEIAYGAVDVEEVAEPQESVS